MSASIKIDPQNPFNEEKPKIVHLEKNESHYEYCRIQMHEIEHTHRRTFVVNMIICILVCFLAIFRVYICGFSLLSIPFTELDGPGATLGGGIFQILAAMGIIIAGYLAWANYHTINILLLAWYGMVIILSIAKMDFISAILGVVGFCFYVFSFQAMRREGALEQMDGYPDFHEKFDINQSDYVIQTLLAHKGEQRERPSFFTANTSLRKKKKKSYYDPEKDYAERNASTEALAAELTKQVQNKKLADTAAEKASDVPVMSASVAVSDSMQSLENADES